MSQARLVLAASSAAFFLSAIRLLERTEKGVPLAAGVLGAGAGGEAGDLALLEEEDLVVLKEEDFALLEEGVLVAGFFDGADGGEGGFGIVGLWLVRE